MEKIGKINSVFGLGLVLSATALMSASQAAQAENVPINGIVQSRCVIQADVSGVYGNPNAYTLSTQPADGGVEPVVRFDVSLAGAYKARISHPTDFSSSPSLPDGVNFTGSTSVKSVSDASGMGTYEANKITYNNVTEYNLTATGSTWFTTSSEARMGGNKAFPGGNYTSMVIAECIAQ